MPARAVLRALSVLVLLALGAADVRAQPSLMVYDWHLGLGPEANLEHVRSLGFSGLVTRLRDAEDVAKLAAYVEHAETLGDMQVMAYVAYDFLNSDSPQVWREALPWLAQAGAPLWVLVRNAPDADAVPVLLREMARESALYDLRTVVYPHWNTDLETADEAAEAITAAGHPNLRNSLHTCHEIRGGHQDDLPTEVFQHVADTALVAIAGAKQDAYAGPWMPLIGWGDVIKPLDKGSFDLWPFLQALHLAGYDGPVLLQTYGITNDPGHLQRSLRAYAAYQERLGRRT